MFLLHQIFELWRWQDLLASWPRFATAFLNTLEIAVLALTLSLFLGVLFGLMSTSHNMALRIITRIYVEFFQNTPLAIQVFFVYYALPYYWHTLRGHLHRRLYVRGSARRHRLHSQGAV